MVSLAGAAGRSRRYSELKLLVGSLAVLFQLRPGVIVCATLLVKLSAVITSSLATEVAPGAVETVAVSWLAPAVNVPVWSSGAAARTFRHSDICATLSMFAGLMVKVTLLMPPGLFG